MNTQILEEIGFTKGEIKVYLALLELGNTTSGPIILQSRVSRSKVYEILERLKEKGLLTESIRENTRYFQATSPERILDYIEQKKQELTKEESDFRKVLPQLLAKQTIVDNKQEVKVYVGFEGVKTFYEEILKQLSKGDEYLAMTFHDENTHQKSLRLFFHKFHQRRAEKGIRAKILVNIKDYEVKKILDFSDTKLYEFKTTKQTLPAGHAIFGDTVAFFNWGKIPGVFVMICKENAEQYKKFFYEIWEKSEKTVKK